MVNAKLNISKMSNKNKKAMFPHEVNDCVPFFCSRLLSSLKLRQVFRSSQLLDTFGYLCGVRSNQSSEQEGEGGSEGQTQSQEEGHQGSCCLSILCFH